MTTAASIMSVLSILLVAAVLTTTVAGEERGVFMADSFTADMTLTAAAKSRKAGPNKTVGPVPAGVAWDGE